LNFRGKERGKENENICRFKEKPSSWERVNFG